MFKLHIVGQELEGKIGGGHSWVSNMSRCFDLVSPEECDIYLITSVSMLPKLSVIPRDKKIVLRVDNVLKKSCNSDCYGLYGDEKITRMEALKQVADIADLVVYQSKWAEEYLDPYLKAKNKVVIMNSGDEKVFKPEGEKYEPIHIFYDKAFPIKSYLYSRSSNHDNKQWHKVYYWWQYQQRKEPDSLLLIAGRFSPENVPNNFDFFNGENIRYLGFTTNKEEMAKYLRSSAIFVYAYSYDACSNSLIEAILSGCDIKYLDKSGGALDIDNAFLAYGKEYFYLDRMKLEYQDNFNKL